MQYHAIHYIILLYITIKYRTSQHSAVSSFFLFSSLHSPSPSHSLPPSVSYLLFLLLPLSISLPPPPPFPSPPPSSSPSHYLSLPLFFQLISGISLTAAKSPEFMSAIVVTVKTFIWSTCAVRLTDYSANNEDKPTPLDSASKIMESSSNTMEITSNSHEISRLQSMFKILNTTDTPNITISYNILSDCAIDENIVNTLTAAVSDGSFNRELRKNYKAPVKVQRGIYLYTVPPIRAPLQLPPANNSKGEIFKI